MYSRSITIAGAVFWFLLTVTSGAWGASGEITITQPSNYALVQSNFSVTGTFGVSSDDTPNADYGRDAVKCPLTIAYPTIGVFGQRPYCKTGDYYYDPVNYAVAKYRIDASPSGVIGYVQQLGTQYTYSVPVNISALTTGTLHTVTVQIIDLYQDMCTYSLPWVSPWRPSWCREGSVIAEEVFTFRVCSGTTDPCCRPDADFCCWSSNPCCGNPDPCCSSGDQCCGKENACCGDPCCENPDPCKCGSGGGFSNGSAGGSGPAASVGGP